MGQGKLEGEGGLVWPQRGKETMLELGREGGRQSKGLGTLPIFFFKNFRLPVHTNGCGGAGLRREEVG